MNEFMKIVLSLSVSGTLVFLLILGLKVLYRNKFSKRWQYYIWIIAVLRFLLPFTPDTTIVGSLFETFHTTVITDESPASPRIPVAINANDSKAEQTQETAHQTKAQAYENAIADTAVNNSPDIYACLFFVWAALALVLFVHKITVYRGFIRYIKAGNTEVSDIRTLNLLSDCEEKLNIRTRAELYRNALVASPIMTGFFRPKIVLPVGELGDKELSYIFLHELIHYRQKDMFYKWLIQLVICVHWFNPFVYLLGKEVNKACELSCDEAVISILDEKARREYGDMLISILKSDNLCKNSFASVTLTEGAAQLKERLGAIMNFRKKSKTVIAVTAIFTITVCFCFFATGAYAAPSAKNDNAVIWKDSEILKHDKLSSAEMERYYEAGSLALLQTAFSRLDEEAQSIWLDRIYADGDIAAFSVCMNQLRTDSPLTGAFAEKFYEEDDVAFFSFIADGMGDETLKGWLDRALEDKKTTFQVILLDKLEMDDELDALEKEWAEEQLKAYRAVGVTKNGKNYYYCGELVNIFLDQRPNRSFYTLDINPQGTVNIKVVRSADGEITGVSYMTGAEAAELFGDAGETPLINTREWDSSAISAIEASYLTDSISVLPSPTDKIILKEYLTQNQSSYYASTEIKNNMLTIRSGDRPAGNYKSYIEIYVPNAALERIKVETVSGAVEVYDYVGVFDLSTTSGAIDVSGSDIAGKIDTISGRIELSPAGLSGDLYVRSTSGEICIDLPDNISYNLKAEATSRTIYPAAQSEGEKEFSRVVGSSPRFTVTLKTTSGNIEIN